MTKLTNEQSLVVDTAALLLVKLPRERRAEVIMELGCAYEDSVEREWPDLSRERVIENSRNFTIAVMQRVRAIDLASGGAPVGYA